MLTRSAPETQPLFTSVESKGRDGVLGVGEKNGFTALPGKGGHGGLVPQKLCPPGGGSEESHSVWGEGRGQLVGVLLIGGW